jgi:circadian clock protein KaiC
MISGESGTAKTTFASHFADAACRRGERCLYLAFEESEAQIVRNMGSVGLTLGRWIKQKKLRIHATRPTQSGLESHLTELYGQVEAFAPDVVVVDPITDFTGMGSSVDVKAMLMRIVDYLKTSGITAVFTSLLHEGGMVDDPTISSLIDNWVQLRNIESDSERNRGIFIQKARGMAHSNQIREFVLSDRGIKLLDVVRSADGVLTGSERERGRKVGR